MWDDGLYVFERDLGDDGMWVRISSGFQVPACVSDPKTGGAYGLWVTFVDEQGRTKELVMPTSTLHGNPPDICAELGDQGLFIDRNYQKDLVGYLLSRMEVTPSADLATTPGWFTPEVYALPDAIFGKQHSGRKVHFGGHRQRHQYRCRGSLKEWKTEVAQLCEGNSRLATSVCAGFAGPLMQDVSENSGGFHFYNKSTTGKTTVQMVGGSVCGGGDPRTGFLSSWRTTSNGLEPLLSSHNDGTLFLDEVGQADPSAIMEMVYTVGNSSGKHRMTRELTAAPTHRWRVLIVSSGEHTLEAHAKRAGAKFPGGAAVRLIDIPADAGKGYGVFENLHGSKSPAEFADKLRTAALRYYGVPIREYLAILTGLLPEDRRKLTLEFCNKFLAACKLGDNASPEVRRAAKRMAVIAAAGEMAILMGILPWPDGHATEGVLTCFNAWRGARGGDDIGHDDARSIQEVRLFLERYGQSRFKRVSVRNSGVDDRPVTDLAGWSRDKDGHVEYLVQPEFFRSQMCTGFDPSAVARALHERRYLRRQGRHWTIRTTLPGLTEKKEVYCILDSLLNSHGEPPDGESADE
jgi:uncharacterized protein (DUF927 family)